MIKKKREPSDISVLAYQIVKEATQEVKEEIPIKEKNPAAVALGRLGGLKGGKARAERLSAKKRTEIARKAAKTRWSKSIYKQEKL
jgi:hypothetical protein